jgi:hypothetical protein
VLDALSARRPQVADALGGGEEAIHESRLADSRFSGDENDLSIAGDGALQSVVEADELVVATNQERSARRCRQQ